MSRQEFDCCEQHVSLGHAVDCSRRGPCLPEFHSIWDCNAEGHAVLWKARAEKAEATIARVEALHVPCSEYPTCADSDNFCHECGHDWPCSTVDALRGPEPTGDGA